MTRPGRIDDVHIRNAGQKGLGIYGVVGWIQNSGVEVASSESAGAHSAVFASDAVIGSRLEDLMVEANNCDHAVEATGNLRVGGIDVLSDPVNTVYSVPDTTVWSRSHVYTFHWTGDLEVIAGAFRMPIVYPVMFLAIRAVLDTAPTGANVILDVNLDAVSIFPTATKPTIGATTNMSVLAFPDEVHGLGGEWLTVDIDQIGSTLPGTNLTVAVLVEPHYGT